MSGSRGSSVSSTRRRSCESNEWCDGCSDSESEARPARRGVSPRAPNRPAMAPDEFDSTILFRTEVRVDGRWLPVARQRMDVGNVTPAGVRLVGVDINAAVVTRLADRSSLEAVGVVTDVDLFLRLPAARLDPA